ncbi:hypothetical protein ACN27E_01745 [Mycobacterium sp. WMMD1722]|uniref:hypothetical protein n=1 Tax=Mycobacterium sp. WMMD1722 TaxID=3404117 RepID=UPI003BF55887
MWANKSFFRRAEPSTWHRRRSVVVAAGVSAALLGSMLLGHTAVASADGVERPSMSPGPSGVSPGENGTNTGRTGVARNSITDDGPDTPRLPAFRTQGGTFLPFANLPRFADDEFLSWLSPRQIRTEVDAADHELVRIQRRPTWERTVPPAGLIEGGPDVPVDGIVSNELFLSFPRVQNQWK